MQLKELISTLSNGSDESIIFADRIRNEFRPDSEAVVLELSETELLRPVHEIATVKAPGMEYFLETIIVQEMLDEWRSRHALQGQSLDELVETIIHYAEHDA
jgi:hypothetical protein